PTSSHSDHQQHQQHPQQANPSLTPSSSAIFSPLPSLFAANARAQDSDSRENSTSSLALSTNLNTRANSSSAHTPIPNSVNPYFPSILPQQPSQSVEHQTAHSSNLNSYRNNLLRSQSSRFHSEHITGHHRDSYLPTPTTPMATPDQSRPGTPDSDLRH
ncbi:hypothetical protein PSTG_18845, partial [Puccinia striiformis f. sp. tritici PST-78]